jgi:hypothetical protein
MAVYLVEIPNRSPRQYDDDAVERTIKSAFPYTDVKVRKKDSGSLADVDQKELYDSFMAAG